MEMLVGARIALTPRPVQRQETVLEAAFLGHCPGRERVDRLLVLSEALDDLRAIGFGTEVDALLAGKMADGSKLSERLKRLCHLPLSLRSSAEFYDIFPDAATQDCDYYSVLAGRRAWLAQAVDDFFANGGEKLWIVRIPQAFDAPGENADIRARFLPAADTALHDVRTLRGLATVLVIPSLGVLGFPDLERLQIPPTLPDVPRVRLENPSPQFLPCGTTFEDDHRERRNPPELIKMPAPKAIAELLRGILQFISRYRPDIQVLFTLPLAYSGAMGSPVVDQRALALLEEIKKTDNRHLLRHMQFLFPYLRSSRFALRSPVGVIAGRQAATAAVKGPWYSIGAQPLVSEALPYPRLSMAQVLALRDVPGVGVLQQRSRFGEEAWLMLDDERLSVPALPLADYVDVANKKTLNGYRSAEVMRFLGYLRRQLQALGEQLAFNVDVEDPRPRLLLDQFFRQLFARGALRGTVKENAYRITQSQPQEGAIQFDIEIAPAFAIDTIYLTFINTHGEWQAEVANG